MEKLQLIYVVFGDNFNKIRICNIKNKNLLTNLRFFTIIIVIEKCDDRETSIKFLAQRTVGWWKTGQCLCDKIPLEQSTETVNGLGWNGVLPVIGDLY